MRADLCQTTGLAVPVAIIRAKPHFTGACRGLLTPSLASHDTFGES